MIWTQALRDAAVAVRDEPEPHPYGHNHNDLDVRSRAREFADHPVGSVLLPHQQEYLVCFIQRLDTRPSHNQFRSAYNA